MKLFVFNGMNVITLFCCPLMEQSTVTSWSILFLGTYLVSLGGCSPTATSSRRRIDPWSGDYNSILILAWIITTT